MRRSISQIGAQLLAVGIVLALAADLSLKDYADLQQVLWSCYWASIAVAMGIFIRVDWLVSSGLVFFLGLGMPVWLLGQLAGRQVDPTSVLIHTLPPAAAALYISQKFQVTKYSAAMAWLLYAIPLALAWLLCDPRENVNLAHAVWPPVAGVLPHLWQFHAFLLGTAAMTVTLAA